MRTFYRCLDCDEVFSVLDSPEEPGAGLAVNAEAEAHRGHHLHLLRSVRGRSWSRDFYDAPARTVWAPVVDGDEEFLLVRRKEGPSLPCRYRLVRGSVVDLPPLLSIQERDLLRQIGWARSGDHPTVEEVAIFVGLLRQAIRRLDAAVLEEEYGDFYNPLLSHARLPPGLLEEVLDRCREHLPEPAAAWFGDFIRDHGDSADIFGVLVLRDFEVVEEEAVGREAARRSVA